MIGELALGRWWLIGRNDPRHDPLAEIGIGLPGDRDLGDARVLEQRGLDLAGADLVAA